MSDLQKLLDALEAKAMQHTLRMNYYAGQHPLVFANAKLHEVFRKSVVFVQNWTEVICNATADRLRILAIDGNEKAPLEYIESLASDVHLACAICGEAYVVAWPTAGGAAAYYHDPRKAHVFYDENAPDIPEWGGKIWCDSEGRRNVALYYRDRIERYVAPKDATKAEAFILDSENSGQNLTGMLPIFHFRRDSLRMTGELTAGVLNIQDAVNKLFTDMMVASEYSSFPQRWAIGNFDTSKPISIGPGTLAAFPGSVQGEQPVSLGAFPTSSPSQYLEPIERLAGSIATISRTPRHYFTGTGGDPSGEALAAMESPLVAKILQIQNRISSTWNSLLAFGWGGGTIIWDDPHTVQPMAQAQIRKTNVEAGIPIQTVLRDEGWTEEQLQTLIEDQSAIVTASTIPNAAALPNSLQSTVGPIARVAAKAANEERATTTVQAALENLTVPESEIKKVITKFDGRRVVR